MKKHLLPFFLAVICCAIGNDDFPGNIPNPVPAGFAYQGKIAEPENAWVNWLTGQVNHNK